MFWLRPAPLWLPLVLFLVSGFLHITASINMNSPKKEIVFVDGWGKERKLDGDNIRDLHKVLTYQGLDGYDLGTLYDLKQSPMSISHNEKNENLIKSIDKLIAKKWVQERDGLWLLTYEGKQVVDSN